VKNFVQKILPDTGIKFIAYKSPYGGFEHHACDTFEEMAAKAQVIDAEGKDAYFACASFKQESYINPTDGKKKQRTAENAGWAKAFWLDIDCGADKAAKGEGYATVADAEFELQMFIRKIGLPMPMVVLSGGGLHCYFPLDKTITKEEWKPVADKLKALTKSNGLKFLADQSRTSDIASILRPVGTHNWKPERAGAAVVLKSDADPIPFDQFSKIIDEAYLTHCTSSILHSGNSSLNATSQPLPESQENIDHIKSALAYIDPDCEREKWLQVCFALRSLGWHSSEELARSWSKGEIR
jgi:hypothetical protein